MTVHTHARQLLLLVSALAVTGTLSGCANQKPITANPQQTVTQDLFPKTSPVVVGLQDAAFNLDSAISIKVLAPGDPVDACVHSALKTLGQDTGGGPPPPPPAQFTPKVSDLISGGSVLYILAQQAKQIGQNGGIAIPASCEQIVGHLALTGINAPANTVIGGLVGALP